MTFLNQPLLWGLFGIAIPIVIHLLNRRKASVVEWGAMRFLLASIASRNRRILIEEILLLAVRCLAMGLIAMAMSRPLLPSGGEKWALALAALPVAAVLGAVAAVLWARRAIRWACLGLAGALVLAAGGALAREGDELTRRWAPLSSAQDVAIVLDGSLSMTLRWEAQTNFQRAIEEARSVIAACGPADTVSIILGGSSPREVVVPGISDRKELLARLDALQPSQGSLRVIPCLMAANSALAKGHNSGKKIVLITDGQSIGWDLPDGRGTVAAAGAGSSAAPPPSAGGGRSEERWRWLAANLAGAGGKAPQIVCRLLGAPADFRNLCVDEVKFSRNVVGTDRPVRIDVKVSNTGASPSAGAEVELLVDGVQAGRAPLEEIPPNASQAVHFQHQFEQPGPKVIEARLGSPDDLPGDNSAFARLDVLEELPILVVEGAPSAEPLGGASAFVQIAMAPGPQAASGRAGSTPASVPASSPRGAAIPGASAGVPIARAVSATAPAPSAATSTAPASAEALRDVARVTVTSSADLPAQDLSRYRVVILAGAPLLPEAGERELAAFVQRGGGLLIVPGEFKSVPDRSATHFYDTWNSSSGKPVSPARLAKWLGDLEPAVHPAPQTFAHPALEMLADPARNYAASVLIHSFWELQADEKDPDVRVAGRLDSGQPLLAERKLGEGRVLLLCVSMDFRQSNLPSVRPFFVPLVHELVYYLAGATASAGNVPGGQEASLPVPRWLSESAAGPGRVLDILTPQAERRPAQIVDLQGQRRLVFSETDSPGVYRAMLPPSARSATAPGGREELFFAVPNEPQESRLDRLTPADLQRVEKMVPISPAANVQELAAFVHGGTPGMEIWQGLALCAALGLVGEIALTHWIARRRKAHGTVPITFGQAPMDVQSFRQPAPEDQAAAAPSKNRDAIKNRDATPFPQRK
jgi:hypothetical protein